MSDKNTMFGLTQKVKVGCGNIYVSLNFQDENAAAPCDVRITLGKPGGCARSFVSGIGAALSTVVELGGDLRPLCKKLRGIMCKDAIHNGAQSCVDAVGMAIPEMLDKWQAKIDAKNTDGEKA